MSTSEHVALVADLIELVSRRVVDPLEILFGKDGSGVHSALVGDRLRIEAEVWAAQLLGRDRDLAVRTASRLIAATFTGDGPFDPPDDWWATPFGRAVARQAGHPGRQAVPFALAGAMLGITRQGVHDLVQRGKLDRHPDGGVATDSIRARLNQSQECHAVRHDHR